MGISNFIDGNLFDNVGNLLEEELLGNDTIPTLKENLRPAGPFESLGSDKIQGNLEVEHSFGADFGDFQVGIYFGRDALKFTLRLQRCDKVTQIVVLQCPLLNPAVWRNRHPGAP